MGNGVPEGGSGIEWTDVYASAEFRQLRQRFRAFVFPMTAAFLVWCGLDVVLAGWAHGFLGYELGENITVGLVFGLLQFVTTFAITALNVRYAAQQLDPIADALHAGCDTAR